MTVKVYTSKSCGPCEEVRKAIEEGKFGGVEEVELVDIETDEGFEEFSKEILSKGDGAVPSAYKDGKKCTISITDDSHLIFSCPTDPPVVAPG